MMSKRRFVDVFSLSGPVHDMLSHGRLCLHQICHFGEASGKSQLDWYFESDICEALVLTDKRGTDEYAILTGTKVRSVNYG